MRKIPSGKDVFLWIPQRMGKTPEELAKLIRNASITSVNIKFHDGADDQSKYYSGYYKTAPLIDFVNKFREYGIDVNGWCAIYPNSTAYTRSEVDVAKKVIETYQPDSWALDIEGRWDGQGDKNLARKYCSAIKTAYPDLPIGMCSYRTPSDHPGVPWMDFLEFCDFHFPQVYWVDAHNPAIQLQKSYEQLMKLKSMPYIPAGSAYPAGKWAPTVSDFREFCETAKKLKCPGISYWELKYIFNNVAWLSEIAAQTYNKDDQPVPVVDGVSLNEWAKEVDPFLREKVGYNGSKLKE